MPGIKPMFKQGALGGECSNHSLPTIFFNDFAQSEKVGLFHAKKYPNIYPHENANSTDFLRFW